MNGDRRLGVQYRIGDPECGSDNEDNDDKGYALHDRRVGWLGCRMMLESNKLLHKKITCCLLGIDRVLDLCGSPSESNDDARFAREGK